MKNKSGFIEGDEVVRLAEWVCSSFSDATVTPERLQKEADKIRKACDKDGNGCIDKVEFVSYYKRIASVMAQMASPKSLPEGQDRARVHFSDSVKLALPLSSEADVMQGDSIDVAPISGAEQRAQARRERQLAAKKRQEEAEANVDEEDSDSFHSDHGDEQPDSARAYLPG